jgi:3-deoxy-manno-octulosonate cytidylyltransferase (CMP-KDO synthetase)
MMAGYRIVIPARMASQRLPGKPLLDIAGRSLLEHVYRRARESSAQEVVIATDDERIRERAEQFGAQSVMTSKDHSSGSDRIAECIDILQWPDDTFLVNLQGDEPLMPPNCLDQAAAMLEADPEADAASLYWPISEPAEVKDPNVVKVVVSSTGAALFFSRSPLPYPRHWGGVKQAIGEGVLWKRHIGLYAYRAGALRKYASLRPRTLEHAEKLEQLRILEYGGRIAMAQADRFIPAGVDTRSDLLRVEEILADRS